MHKHRMIYSLTTFFVVFNMAHAMDIKHGALISHKEWNSGQFSSSFLDVKSKPKYASLLKETNRLMAVPDFSDFFDATVNLTNTQLVGTTNTPTLISSTSNLTINNMTSTSQTYNIITRICVQAPSATAQCATSYDVIQLDVQGVATISRLPSMNITLPNAATYTTIAGIAVSENQTTRYSFWTTGELTISNPT